MLSAQEWQQRIEAALEAKQLSAEEARRKRRHRAALIAAAELARRRGGAAAVVPVVTQADRQQLERWRQRRSFVVLVAVERASGQVLGSAAVSLATPEAVLPPPWPTSKPRRVYVSNIAVAVEHRRQGVATALLRRCERQARLWRQDSLWLHCELRNPALQVRRRAPPLPARRAVSGACCMPHPCTLLARQRSPACLPTPSLLPPPPYCSCMSARGMLRWGGTPPSPPTAAA